MNTTKRTEQADAFAQLRKLLKPGDTLHTTLKHCSASGMYRVLDVYVFRKNEPLRLSWAVAKVLDWRYDKRHEGLGVNGCGMDVGFHAIHTLGYALYGKEASEGTNRKATALRKALLKADRFYFTQGGAPEPDPTKPDGLWFGGAGYALKHRWL